jgi:uncharacterized protein
MPTALITGGTSGIGAGFARALAERGDDLVLVARGAERLAASAEALTQRYAVSVETMSADLSVRADVLQVAERVSSQESPIDLLVNNAGFGIRARLTDADLSPHDEAIDVMIKAVLILAGSAGRAMRERGRGTIINVSSTAGFVSLGNYSAIKAWVLTYSESLANELAGSGVQVTVVCPGWVRTEFHDRAKINAGSIPKQLWLDTDRVVADCLSDVAAHKVISIPSMRFRALMVAVKLAPAGAVRAVSRKISSSRH